MNLLIAREDGKIMRLSEGDWQEKRLPYQISHPCMPCANQTLLAIGSARDEECLCVQKRGYELLSRMPAAPGLSAMCLSPCGRYLYQLSSEADSIHTRLTATGELQYAAPCGVFPRMMRLRSDGNSLIAAGGAIPEAYVFSAPDLRCQKVIPTRHPCFAADECARGMVLVCAREGHDIQTMIYILHPGTVRPRRLLELPGQPGGMCVCPGGRHILVSTPDGLMKIALEDGQILWNQPKWALCMQLCCRGSQALVSDTLDGKAYLINHLMPWESRLVGVGGVQACFA